MTEQLYGGKHDGLEVQTENRPDYIMLPDGSKYYRRRDGKLYQEGCLWNEVV